MSADNSLPPTPYQTPISDRNGILNLAWSKWFQALFIRTGGLSAPSITGIVSSITTLQANVATLEAEVTALQASNTSLQNLVNGLTIGRQL